MAKKVPKTKKGKAAKMEKVMHEFKEKDLHSGSKTGPKVKSRAQAIAIGLKQSGQSKYGGDAGTRGSRLKAKKKGIVSRVGKALS